MDKLKKLISHLQPAGIVTREKKIRVFVTTFLACLLVVFFAFQILSKKLTLFNFPSPRSVSETTPLVSTPTIVDGKIVFPGKDDDLSYIENLGKKGPANLVVLTADLIGVYDQSQDPKMVGIRIIGETKNISSSTVTKFTPIVKFIDADGKVVTQKIGKYSDSFNFYGVDPEETTLYDVTIAVSADQLTDRLEVLLNGDTASLSAELVNLKIENRNFEVKTASNSDTGEQVEYYSVTGNIINTFSEYVTDITITGWVKNKDGLVFSVGNQVYKDDLVGQNGKLDFKIPLLPLKGGFKYESYELRAWGKLFKL